jgi:predicted transposase YbfD/YdcC
MTTAVSPAALIETHFGGLKDPRSSSRIEHKLIDILIITICATICGANDWEAIAEYGRTKQDWLKTWLELPSGIPSPDKTKVSEKSNEITAIPPLLELLAIRGCLVSIADAYAFPAERSANGGAKPYAPRFPSGDTSRFVSPSERLRQRLRRALHQADAIGCQTEIAKTIVEQGADYVLALKGNQGDLHTDVAQLFTSAQTQNFRNIYIGF